MMGRLAWVLFSLAVTLCCAGKFEPHSGGKLIVTYVLIAFPLDPNKRDW